MTTNDTKLSAAGRRGASTGLFPSCATDRIATQDSRRDSRVPLVGMQHHDRPIGPGTMR